MTTTRRFWNGLLFVVLSTSGSAIGCAQPDSDATSKSGTEPAAAPPPAAAPDVTASDTNVDVGQVRVVLSVPQRPITPLEKERFCVRAEIDGIPADLAKGHITFDMASPIGAHRYELMDTGDGCHSADVVLPAGPDGGTRWYATVVGVVDEQPVTARFQFDVAWSAVTPPS